MKIKLVYIAGKYRGKTANCVDQNILMAKAAAVQVAKWEGPYFKDRNEAWFPVTPHLNTAHFDHFAPEVDVNYYLEGTLEMLRRCDAALFLQGWRESEGARGEFKEARRLFNEGDNSNFGIFFEKPDGTWQSLEYSEIEREIRKIS